VSVFYHTAEFDEFGSFITCFQDSTYNPIAALVHISPLGTLAHAVHFMRFLAISQDICMGLRLL